MDAARSVPQPCGRYFLGSLTGNKEGSKGLMVLRVKPTPTRFPANNIYTPMDNTPMHSISSVCHPWGSCRRAHERRSIADVRSTVVRTQLLHIKLGANRSTIRFI